jgi:hypothetical protein
MPGVLDLSVSYKGVLTQPGSVAVIPDEAGDPAADDFSDWHLVGPPGGFLPELGQRSTGAEHRIERGNRHTPCTLDHAGIFTDISQSKVVNRKTDPNRPTSVPLVTAINSWVSL